MESLELPRLFLHHTRTSSAPTRPSHTNSSSRFLPQLAFPSKLKKPTKNATLRSISGDTDGASPASPDGPISFEDDQDRGRLLSREIDDFGSLVAFRLTPHDSGIYLSIYAFLFYFLFSIFLLFLFSYALPCY
jgi:hypothetical protein